MRKCIFVAVLLAASAVHSQESDDAIHDELRAVLATLQDAINRGDYDAMLPAVSADIRATTITQEVLSSHADVSDYFRRWFGPGGFLAKLEMTMTPDALTELSPDRTWGLVRGSGIEHYTLADGREYDMPTRWTAVVAKEADGRWRLRSIHIGTDFLDNPILTEASHTAVKIGIGGALGGLLVGALLGFLAGRRKK
jgi:ketosteroid isomerase-like protein